MEQTPVLLYIMPHLYVFPVFSVQLAQVGMLPHNLLVLLLIGHQCGVGQPALKVSNLIIEIGEFIKHAVLTRS